MRTRALRSLFAFCIVLLLVAAGCASRPAVPVRTALPPMSLASHPEAWPVQHVEGPVVVSVDPVVDPERWHTVFGTAFHLQSLLPIELLIQNQGTQRLRLSQADIAL